MKFKIIGSAVVLVIILIAFALSHSGAPASQDGAGSSETIETQ